jgi:acylphosphatase
MNQAFRAIVHGRVQGVFFRRYTDVTAKELSVSGWVRNQPDGTVEVWAEGPKDRLEKLAAWLKQGPPSAVVRRVELSWHEPKGYVDFKTKY